ncbi:MAG: dTMP kinase [Coleofasciculaceae cyanobacterium]
MGGKLIVFEGVEGAGKTTQIQQTRDWLEASGLLYSLSPVGKKVPLMVTKEPGGTSLGMKLRQLLLSANSSSIQDRTELILYAADRTQHVEEFLKPQLAQGAIVLCDRYTDSTIAYQGYGRGLDLTLIEQLNQIATGGLDSDLTLWLDVEVETGLKRMQKRGSADRIEQADLAFHQRVQQGFRSLHQQNPDRIAQVDADRSEAEVQASIQEILQQRFKAWFQKLSPTS